MVKVEKIEQLLDRIMDESMFLVDLKVSPSNVIQVFVDSFNGLTIDQCVSISRQLEQGLDRDADDFELQVSSPGLSESFKVKEQYQKNQGREVVIDTNDGRRITGLLEKAGDQGVVIKTSKRRKVEGHKKKQLVEKEHSFDYGEIKSAKVVVSFKNK